MNIKGLEKAKNPYLFLFDGFAKDVKSPALSTFTGALLDAISLSDPCGTVVSELRGGLPLLSDFSAQVSAVSVAPMRSSYTQSHDMALYRLLLWDMAESLSSGPSAPDARMILNILGKRREECLALSDLESDIRDSCNAILKKTPGYIGCCPLDPGNPVQRAAFFDGLMHLALISDGTIIQQRSIEGDEDWELEGARRFRPSGLRWIDYTFASVPKKFELGEVAQSERGEVSVGRLKRKTNVTVEGKIFKAIRDACWTDHEGRSYSFSAVETGIDILKAILPEGKFTKYLFDKEHKKGGAKARFIIDELGFDPADWRYLAAQLYDGLLLSNPHDLQIEFWPDGFGARFNVYTEVTSRCGKSGILRAGWMLVSGKLPSLATAVPDRCEDGVIKPPPPPILEPGEKDDGWWERLFLVAKDLGSRAHDATLPTPMVLEGYDVIEEGECGFAYVLVDDTRHGFARWLIKAGIGQRRAKGGVTVLCDTPSQSVERAEAYALTFARVLTLNGVPSQTLIYRM